MISRILLACAALLLPLPLGADVGDPQVATDHPWYPGELACSTFERLFETQAALYERVVGRRPETDEERALASWLWRNTHYAHGEEGAENLWGKGFGPGHGDLRTRDYWTGLFSHGFGLCGTTHSQWTAEVNALLGRGRARGVGVSGHNAFEVFLAGGAYGEGRWALLDHDISTVIFAEDGSRLLSIREVKENLARLGDPDYRPEKQRGWRVSGLHPRDALGVYDAFEVAEYLPGYAGARPLVRLRRGETFRRYLEPGLEDGKTFVFWGRNYSAGGIPGPERSRTWVNQPEAMYRAQRGTSHVTGQVRFANAVFTWRPDFASGDHREGVVDESGAHVTLEHVSPYIIAATPAGDGPWGVYEAGGRNGLVVESEATCAVTVSVDRGQTWLDGGSLPGRLDLTDSVKGHRQYWLRLTRAARDLAGEELTIRTVCQVNPSVLPRLVDGGARVRFESSGRGLVSAGPTLAQARAHRVEGDFGSPRLTLEVGTPRGRPVRAIHASAHVASSNPPSPGVRYRIEFSTDGGDSWREIVGDWRIERRGDEPADFWSQSFCYGSIELPEAMADRVRVRFRNDGGKRYLRAEAHLEYEVEREDRTRVTFAWTDERGDHEASRVFAPGRPPAWSLSTGQDVKTRWVEFAAVR